MDDLLNFHYQGKTSKKNSKNRHPGKGLKTIGATVGIIDVATASGNFELSHQVALEISLTELGVFGMEKNGDLRKL